MNPRFFCFDLEMNQPSKKIIQIGGLIGRLDTGEIIKTFNYYINPHETIHPFITELTGITQDIVDSGIELIDAVREIEQEVIRLKACKSPIVWGNGDLKHLQYQSGLFRSVRREIDIKTIYQWGCLKHNKSMKGGLASAIKAQGNVFVGKEHNALDDAINTFNLARVLYKNE